MVLQFLKWNFALGLLFNLAGLICFVLGIPNDADPVSVRWFALGAAVIMGSWMSILMSYPYGWLKNQRKVQHAVKMLEGEIWSEPLDRPVDRRRLVEALLSLRECEGYSEEDREGQGHELN